jgi:hypothetical protein
LIWQPPSFDGPFDGIALCIIFVAIVLGRRQRALPGFAEHNDSENGSLRY